MVLTLAATGRMLVRVLEIRWIHAFRINPPLNGTPHESLGHPAIDNPLVPESRAPCRTTGAIRRHEENEQPRAQYYIPVGNYIHTNEARNDEGQQGAKVARRGEPEEIGLN